MVAIRKILSTLSSDEISKAALMKCLKNKGVKLDDFPRTRLSVESVAEGLTRAEDSLELRRGERCAALRLELRAMRRSLEDALEA